MSAPPTLRPYQLEAGRAIIDSVVNRRGLSFTVVMARQAGKNELSAPLKASLLFRYQWTGRAGRGIGSVGARRLD